MIRVLLDEDVPVKLRHHFGAEFHVETVQYRGWKGLRNGDLLRVAQEDFEALITLDSKLALQQDVGSLDLAVMVLRARSTRFEDLLELIPAPEGPLPPRLPDRSSRSKRGLAQPASRTTVPDS